MKEFASIAELLRTLLPTHGERPAKPNTQARLQQVWNESSPLGKVHLHSWPLLFTSGRLVVFVESPTWGTELRHQSHRLMKTLAKHGIAVQSVAVKTQPLRPVQSRQTKHAPARLSAENAAQIKLLAEQITHPQFQRALLKLAKHAPLTKTPR